MKEKGNEMFRNILMKGGKSLSAYYLPPPSQSHPSPPLTIALSTKKQKIENTSTYQNIGPILVSRLNFSRVFKTNGHFLCFNLINNICFF